MHRSDWVKGERLGHIKLLSVQDLGLDPLDSTPKPRSWGQRVFVLLLRAISLTSLTLRARSEPLA